MANERVKGQSGMENVLERILSSMEERLGERHQELVRQMGERDQLRERVAALDKTLAEREGQVAALKDRIVQLEHEREEEVCESVERTLKQQTSHVKTVMTKLAKELDGTVRSGLDDACERLRGNLEESITQAVVQRLKPELRSMTSAVKMSRKSDDKADKLLVNALEDSLKDLFRETQATLRDELTGALQASVVASARRSEEVVRDLVQKQLEHLPQTLGRTLEPIVSEAMKETRSAPSGEQQTAGRASNPQLTTRDNDEDGRGMPYRPQFREVETETYNEQQRREARERAAELADIQARAQAAGLEVHLGPSANPRDAVLLSPVLPHAAAAPPLPQWTTAFSGKHRELRSHSQGGEGNTTEKEASAKYSPSLTRRSSFTSPEVGVYGRTRKTNPSPVAAVAPRRHTSVPPTTATLHEHKSEESGAEEDNDEEEERDHPYESTNAARVTRSSAAKKPRGRKRRRAPLNRRKKSTKTGKDTTTAGSSDSSRKSSVDKTDHAKELFAADKDDGHALTSGLSEPCVSRRSSRHSRSPVHQDVQMARDRMMRPSRGSQNDGAQNSRSHSLQRELFEDNVLRRSPRLQVRDSHSSNINLNDRYNPTIAHNAPRSNHMQNKKGSESGTPIPLRMVRGRTVTRRTPVKADTSSTYDFHGGNTSDQQPQTSYQLRQQDRAVSYQQSSFVSRQHQQDIIDSRTRQDAVDSRARRQSFSARDAPRVTERRKDGWSSDTGETYGLQRTRGNRGLPRTGSLDDVSIGNLQAEAQSRTTADLWGTGTRQRLFDDSDSEADPGLMRYTTKTMQRREEDCSSQSSGFNLFEDPAHESRAFQSENDAPGTSRAANSRPDEPSSEANQGKWFSSSSRRRVLTPQVISWNFDGVPPRTYSRAAQRH